ncbi:MAG: hypothetical protein ACRENK_10275 [Gemmatimonadaceae bacterium]
MGWYELALVVHFLGLIAIAGFFVIYSRAGPALRKATDMANVRVWLGMLDAAKPMMPAAGVLLILSGFVMASMRWRGPYPFVTVGLVTLIIIWIAAAIVGGRHRRAMQAAAGTATGSVPAELSRVILNPRPWATLFALNLATLGVLFVMTTKIGWVAAISVVIGLAIVGAFIGARLATGDRDRFARGASAR